MGQVTRHCPWVKLASEAIASLTDEERETCIAYMEQQVIEPGGTVPGADITEKFVVPVAVVFIDLEPGMNWTHRGRYLIMGLDGGIQRRFDVDRPPFLASVSPYLRLIHRGSQAPAWAAMISTGIQ